LVTCLCCASLLIYVDCLCNRMAATNLDTQGGFVATANMVQGAPAIAGAALGEPDPMLYHIKVL
jgi:hypothetical protein